VNLIACFLNIKKRRIVTAAEELIFQENMKSRFWRSVFPDTDK
jgi:hypothetical protein